MGAPQMQRLLRFGRVLVRVRAISLAVNKMFAIFTSRFSCRRVIA